MEKLTAKQTASDLTEAEAIKQAQAGDAAAFEFLYKAHCRRVYSLCLRMIKNPAEAEDLTQQAFLQLFRKIGTFRGESGFSTWLHRVTVNIVLMHIRRHKPAEFPVEDLERYSSNGEGPFEDGSSDTSMLGAIDRLNLMRAIRKLPAGYKKLFLMHDVIGYEHSEIAGLLGCSIGCSKSQVHKARKKLRRLLQGEHRRGEAGVAPAWEEADAEALPFEDASFDIVASLVGAMFAPRPDLVAQELPTNWPRLSTDLPRTHLQAPEGSQIGKIVLTLGEDNYDTRIRFVERPCAGRALWKTQGCYRHRCVERDRPRGGKKAGRVWLPRGCQLTQHYIC